MIDDLRESTKAALQNGVASFRTYALLSTLGGLQLLPENASVALRLEALVQVATASAPGGNRTLKRADVEALVNGLIAGTEIPLLEDPQAYPFVESLAFHGGNYLLVNGVFDGSASRARLLAAMLARLHAGTPASDPARPLVDQTFELFFAALVVSDRMARSARLHPEISIAGVEPEGAAVPPTAVLNRLQSAVTFAAPELTALLAKQHLSPAALGPLIAGNLSPSTPISLSASPFLMTPLVQFGDRLIVTVPSALLPAACHQVITLFHQAGHTELLMQAYSKEAWTALQGSLEMLGHEPRPPLSAGVYAALSVDELPRIRATIGSLDKDKLLLAVLVTDDLRDYDPGTFMGGTGRPLDLDAFCQAAITALYEDPEASNEVFLLIVPYTLRDGALISVKDFGPLATTLPITSDDLNVVAHLESGKPLRLYKFAKTLHELKTSVNVPSVGGTLDLYAFYKNHRYSFYLGDDGRYTGIFIQPGLGLELREEIQRRWQVHLVPGPDHRSLVQVGNFHQREDCLMFAPFAPVNGRFGIYIEELGRPLWILAEPVEAIRDEGLQGTYFHLTEMLGYWLWQFAPLLTPWFAKSKLPMLEIYLHLRPSEGWRADAAQPSSPDSADDDPFTIQVMEGRSDIHIVLSPAFQHSVAVRDNSGERRLIQALLKTIHRVAVGRLPPSGEIEVAVEQIAPLGLKRAFLAIDVSHRPELMPGKLPKTRTVQAEDQDSVLEGLAGGLLFGMPPGPVPDQERIDLLNRVVGELYREFELLITTLRGDELRLNLLAQHEALVKDATFYNVTLPTQIACYAANQQVTDEMSERMAKFAGASLASRFLIEYVAARPPSGVRPFSFTVYDRLMALASQLIGFAHESDYIKYELANLPVEILGSGRIGVDREGLNAGMQAYQAVFNQGELARATDAIGRLWGETSGSGDSERVYEEFNTAMKIELGFTLPELMELTHASFDIASGDVYSADMVEFTGRLATQLNWPGALVTQVLDQLSLTERPDFLNPPAPYKPFDTFPWLFNRRLSFLQKPYLRHGARITFGPRSIHQAAQHLSALLLGGRYRALSPELKRQYGFQTNKRGEHFNQGVATLLKSSGYAEVKLKLKRIGGLAIASDKGTLGDIDVFVVDRARHRILLLECKNLSNAKTPAELHMEVQTVLQGRKGEKSLVAHHQQRADWFRDHQETVLAAVGAAEPTLWTIVPLLVVDTELMAGHFQASSIPLVPIHQLIEYLTG